MKSKFFSWFCFIALCFCLLIILWGAWVRISHSGDGCGQSWPSCQGKYLIDSEQQEKTWIEWIHRATSGLFGIMVIFLVLLSFLKFPAKSPVRKISIFILLFTVSEALIGARLVLAGLTGSNTSLARVLTMNIHLLNSFLLTISLFICWRLSLGKKLSFSKIFEKEKRVSLVFIFIFFLIAFLGSFSSLASSLFPSSSLLEGISLDFNPKSHWLIRLRLLHPLLAFLLGGGLLFYCLIRFVTHSKNTPLNNSILVFLFLALLSGMMNLLLLSPVFLKLTHLLIVYLLLMSFILSLEHSQSISSTENKHK